MIYVKEKSLGIGDGEMHPGQYFPNLFGTDSLMDMLFHKSAHTALEWYALIFFLNPRAEEAVIHLDHVADLTPGVHRSHCSPELMEHSPYGVVVLVTELTLEFRCRYVHLRARQQVHRYKPIPDRKLASVRHSIGFQALSVMTAPAPGTDNALSFLVPS